MKKFMKMPEKRHYRILSVQLGITMLFLTGCKSGGFTQMEPIEKELAYEILEQGSHSNFLEKENILISDQQDLEEVYNTINRTIVPKKSIPQIDFSENAAIISCMGEKRTGGYSIGIDSIIVSEKNIIIHLKEVSPRPGEMVITVITSPYVIYTFKKEDKKILFEYGSN